MRACPNCPFREVVGLPYTDDGHTALEDGHQPSCHLHTPHGMQFDDPFPSEEIECKGYHLYMAIEPGFSLPKRISATTPQGKL